MLHASSKGLYTSCRVEHAFLLETRHPGWQKQRSMLKSSLAARS